MSMIGWMAEKDARPRGGTEASVSPSASLCRLADDKKRSSAPRQRAAAARRARHLLGLLEQRLCLGRLSIAR